MRYYSEVDENNRLYAQRVCTVEADWVPTKEGLRLVIDEEPVYDKSTQTLERLDIEITDRVPYIVKELELPPLVKQEVGEIKSFLAGKNIETVFYTGIQGYSLLKDIIIYRLYQADSKYIVKCNETVLEWYEITDFGGYSLDINTGSRLETYKTQENGDWVKYELETGAPITRYSKSEPETRGSLSNDVEIVFWSKKSNGDTIIEFRNHA
jgi:hypothetical protein